MTLNGIKFEVRIIPHEQQRYETCGDWWLDDSGVWQVRISELGDPSQENLIALHEIVEILISLAKLPFDAKPEEMVAVADEFDKRYEAARHPADDTSEPGYVPSAPYYRPHMIASAIEHLVAMELNVDYNLYGDAVASLSQN